MENLRITCHPATVAQAPQSIGFPSNNTGVGHTPSPGDLPGIKPTFPALSADFHLSHQVSLQDLYTVTKKKS